MLGSFAVGQAPVGSGADTDAAGAPSWDLTGSNCSQANTSSTGIVSTVLPGVLTLPPMKNNTGTVLASQTGITVFVHNVATGALLDTLTGQTTNASGVLSASSTAAVAGTTYRLVIVMSGGAEGMDKVTAT